MRRPTVVAFLFLLAAGAAAAQTPSNDWSQVRQLFPGQSVRVLSDGEVTRQGLFVSAADDSLTLNVEGTEHRLARAAIRDVAIERLSRRRNIWADMAFGGAASASASSVRCRGAGSSCDEGTPAYFYPIAAAGRALGALLPSRNAWRAVYVRTP